jgi:hypothetical protein
MGGEILLRSSSAEVVIPPEIDTLGGTARPKAQTAL